MLLLRILSVVFMIAGIIMIWKGEIFIQQAQVINDYGEAIINKSSSRSIGFPWYAGPLCILTGLLLWHAGKK